MADTRLQLECTQGEDAVWQLYWLDDYNEPIPVADPVLADVKDANGQVAIRFSSNADPDQQAKITLSTASGFIQLSAPSAVTRTLYPGKYMFDLFASVADSPPPFNRQLRQVVSGFFVVQARTTRIEQAPETLTVPNPSGN